MAQNSLAALDQMAGILRGAHGIALLIGNGVNRFTNNSDSSWDDLLAQISHKQNVALTDEELREMSNAELFDILDLARPTDDRLDLQRTFCDLMQNWKHAPHHSRIVGWAQRHFAPIITVNFDENLSRSVGARFFAQCGDTDAPGFTDFYPWRSYFGSRPIALPLKGFGIWHAHGMMRYARSIRLGLTHYMGSVHRARAWIYRTDNSLIRYLQGKSRSWNGIHTWLHPFFFSDIALVGFGFGKDETFLRWLFLERARLYKRFPSRRKKSLVHRRRQRSKPLQKTVLRTLGPRAYGRGKP